MLVLAVDVMTGSRLQLSSLMGLQPVVGGRYYGMGNPTFALFATSTILLCIAVSDRSSGRARTGGRPPLWPPSGWVAVVVDATPVLGCRRRRPAGPAARAASTSCSRSSVSG